MELSNTFFLFLILSLCIHTKNKLSILYNILNVLKNFNLKRPKIKGFEKLFKFKFI